MDNGLEHDAEETESFLTPPSAGRIKPLEIIEGDAVRFPADGRAPGLRHRKGTSANAQNGSTSFLKGFVQGIMRENIGHTFTFRNMFLLCCIAGVLLVALIVLKDQTDGDFDGIRTPAPHTNSFGGVNNPGVQHGSSGHFQRPPMITDEDLPKSNVGHAVLSLSPLNWENHPGHFRHDPKHSPYASYLYAENVESESQRQRLQTDHEKRFQAYTYRYGQWKNPSFPGKMAQTPYHNYWYKDVEEFPPGAWQANKEYMNQFLREGFHLVERVRDAIYEEYGFGLIDVDESDRDTLAKIKSQRAEFMGVKKGNFPVHNGAAIIDGRPFRGAAYLNQAGWDGLVRKMMHAIMTEDEFYVVVAGPASTTYEGVSLQQTHIMQFHDVMEPVFDRLGIRLISRNMGMDASTTVSALGGGDLYGESDIFWYRQDHSDPEPDMQVDLLLKQTILSGERLPVVLTSNSVSLKVDTNDLAWIGNIQPGPMGCEKTYIDDDNVVVLPDVKACAYVDCSERVKEEGICRMAKDYPCWIERQMTIPMSTEELGQKSKLGRNSATENYRQHQLEGRKLSLLVLDALAEALGQMILSQASDKSTTLPPELWHVNGVYGEIRDMVRRVKNKSKLDPADLLGCDKLLWQLDSEICHMEMHAYSEWTPRVTPNKKGLASIAATDIYVNETEGAEQLYEWFDLLPFSFIPDDDEVDVHMVAILGQDPDSRRLGHSQIADSAGRRERRESSRFLLNETSNDGNPWRLHGAPIGFCDGSAMSWCQKTVPNDCLLANRNHYKAGMLSRGSSDWLVLKIGEIKEGVLLLRFEWFGDEIVTPEDLVFFHSVNGTEGDVKSIPGDQFKAKHSQLAPDLLIYPVMINKKWSHDNSLFGNVTLALRFETKQQDWEALLTHVYYA